MMSTPSPIPVLVPRENVNDESATLVAWIAADGAQVEPGQNIAQLETSKAVVELPSPASGTLRHVAKPGQDIAIGGVLAWVGAGVPVASTPAAPIPSSRPTNGDAVHYTISLSPSVRRIVAEENVDPSQLKGTGRGGRITKADVLDHLSAPASDLAPNEPSPTRISLKARALLNQLGLTEAAFANRGLLRSRDLQPTPETPAPTSTPAPAPPTSPVAATGVPVRAERLSRAKRTEARYLRSGFETTLASVVAVACPTRGLRAAAAHFPAIEGNAAALIVFEAARLLKIYPALNAYHADGTAHYYDEVNIGFAVDAGRGLKVPVIHQADAKGIAEIASEMRELVVAYLNDSLPLDALAGGTFTITDLSGEGVTMFHPLINQGQSAILGVCAEVFPGGAREGAYNLVLAFDHQLSEGRSAAQFLGALRDRLAHYEKAAPVSRDDAPAPAEEPRCARCQAGIRELNSAGQWLVQTAAADGSVRLVCQLCFEGWT